jgi:hypothetical protein
MSSLSKICNKAPPAKVIFCKGGSQSGGLLNLSMQEKKKKKLAQVLQLVVGCLVIAFANQTTHIYQTNHF